MSMRSEQARQLRECADYIHNRGSLDPIQAEHELREAADTIEELAAKAKPKMMTELKPCPFCGGEGHLYANEGGVCVLCLKCRAQSIKLSDLYSSGRMAGNATIAAIEAWNRRA